MDRTTLFDMEFRKRITKIAEENHIPYQYRKSSMGGNDSGKIHTTKEGSVTATISVPCRNIHSPTSVMSKQDYENTYKLLKTILLEYEKGGNFNMKFNSQLMEELVTTYGPSGNEDNIRIYIKEQIEDYVDKIEVDSLGNLIARKKR